MDNAGRWFADDSAVSDSTIDVTAASLSVAATAAAARISVHRAYSVVCSCHRMTIASVQSFRFPDLLIWPFFRATAIIRFEREMNVLACCNKYVLSKLVKFKLFLLPLSFLARTASRCRRAYILPLWFLLSFFLSFFDAKSLRSLNRSQPNLDTYSLVTDIWKNGPNSPGHLPPTG